MAEEAVPMAVETPGVVAITSLISGGLRVWNLGNGVKMQHVEMTFKNAASAMPVAGEVQLPRAIWQRMGFQRIMAIPEITIIKGSDRSTIPGTGMYDPQAGKIVMWDKLGAAIDATAIGNNGSLRMLVLGV